jgi:hypothetical protein
MISMKKTLCALLLLVASVTFTSSVFAQDWPMRGGDYWEVAAIDIKDGGGLKYTRWLADEWRKNNEFAKSKGWIKDYFVLENVHNRKGEADLYLIQVRENLTSGPEGEKRAMEFLEWRKKTADQMAAESGNRAEYREVMSSSLLQVLNFRD